MGQPIITVDLSYEEYRIIRIALEAHYYLSKDEGDNKTLDAITELESKLINLYIQSKKGN